MNSVSAKMLEQPLQSEIASVPSASQNGCCGSRAFNVRATDSGGAVFDKTGNYRYLLWRNLASTLVVPPSTDRGTLLMVMLNPNKADETRNDPTIRRCIGFAQLWGYSRLEVVNLFAICAEKPHMLRNFKKPIGTHNDGVILERANHAGLVLVAWGNYGGVLERDVDVLTKLRPYGRLECFGTTKIGMPRHPLYVRADVKPSPFQ